MRLSRMLFYLPCNEKGELIGIDAEVVNFHANQTGTPLLRSSVIPVGEYYLGQIPKILERFL